MLELFRNNQLETTFFVILYAVAFATNAWLQPFPDSQAYLDTANSLGQLIYRFLGTATWLHQGVFVLLLLVQAFVLNSVVNNYRLAKRVTFVTAISYILLSFSFAQLDYLSPAFMANLFVIFALQNLYETFSKKVLLGNMFNAGFWIAIAGLIYPAMAVYILVMIIGLLILRPFKLREMLVLLGGYLSPLFLWAVYQFANGRLGSWWQEDVRQHYFGFSFEWQVDTWFYVGLASLGMVFLWALLNAGGIYFKTTIREKKFINIVYLMLLIGGLSFLGQNEIHVQHFHIFTVPLAILFSLNLQSLRSKGQAEFMHLLLFMACLCVQYVAVLGLG